MNRLILFFALSLLALAPFAFADIPHLISLQGKLTDATNNPLTSTANFVFRIYTSQTGGTPAWTETQNSIPLDTLGIFSVLLGSATALNIPFDSSYWLEVQVQSGTGPAQVLSPRQRMGSAGYALRAENPWNATGNDIYTTNAGNVGIGTSAPTEKLEVAGNVKATAFKGDGSQLTGISSSQWANSGSNIYYNTGNVGIGNPSPGQKLDVNGNIQLSSGGNLYLNGGTSYGLFSQDIRIDTLNTGITNDPLEINYRVAGPVKICSSINCGTYSAYFDTSGNVGIGTASPGAKLDVAGNVKIADGTQGAGKVLTSDANGVASWQPAGGVQSRSLPNPTINQWSNEQNIDDMDSYSYAIYSASVRSGETATIKYDLGSIRRIMLSARTGTYAHNFCGPSSRVNIEISTDDVSYDAIISHISQSETVWNDAAGGLARFIRVKYDSLVGCGWGGYGRVYDLNLFY